MMNEMLQVHLVLTHCKKCLLHASSLKKLLEIRLVKCFVSPSTMCMSPAVSSLHIVSIVFTRTDNNTMHYADKVQSIQSIQAVSEAAYRQHITSDFIVSRIVNYKFTLLFVSNLSLWSYP